MTPPVPDRPPGLSRTDWALALGFAAVTVATRWPYRARILPTWDAVQFALALGEYDVVRHQPHPPGYILYVGAGRLLTAAGMDPTTALALLAVGASALTVVLLYHLAWRQGGRAPAVLAAAGLVASPLFWANGAVGLSYAAEATLATAIALAAWAMRDGRTRMVVGAAALLGVGAGVRQSLLLLLGPLWLGTAWLSVRRWRPILLGLGVLALAVSAWLVPMLWLTGGLKRYVEAGLELYTSTVHATTLAAGGWGYNVVGLGVALLLGVGLLLPVLVVGGWGALRALGHGAPDAVLLALWVGPAVLVYAFVHLGQLGYLLTILPACYLVIGRVLASWLMPAGPAGGRGRPVLVGAGLVAVLAAHVWFFTAAPPVDVAFPDAAAPWAERAAADLRGVYRFRLWPETAGGLHEREAIVRAYVDTVRRDFDPRDTVLVTELGNPRSYPWFRHAMYYLPEFPVYHLRLGEPRPGYLVSRDLGAMAAIGTRRVPLPTSTRRLVWVVDHWHPGIRPPAGLEARALPHGRWLYVLRVGRRPIEYAGYRLVPVTTLARAR